MIYFKDPSRLSEIEDVPRELRAMLNHAQYDGLSIEATAQLVRAVEGRAGENFVSVPDQSSFANPQASAKLGAVAGTGPLMAKLFVVLATIGLGCGVWYLNAHHRGSPNLGGEPAAVVSTLPSVTTAALLQQETRLVSSIVEHNVIAPNPEVQSLHVSPRQRNGAVSHVVGATRGESAAEQGANARAELPSSSSDPAKDKASEFRLLRAARQALSSDPVRALELAAEHAKRFPNGVLGQEREAIAIESLARLGRTSQAKSRADRFFIKYPTSPYRERLETMVSNPGRQGVGH